jgi:hypothetical protein
MLIKNSLIMKKEFMDAFSNLMLLKMSAKRCLEVSSCIEDIMAQYQIVQRARKSIADKYCQKNDVGKPLSDKEGNLMFDTPEIQKQCTEELLEIYEEEIDLALTEKIKISGDQMMTPLEVSLLKDIIDIDDN